MLNMRSYNPSSLLIIFSLLFLLIFDLTVAGSCPSKCGGIDIPYPFGIGKGCYLNKWYEIKCDHNNSLSVSGKPVPVLSLIGKKVVDISLPESLGSYGYYSRMPYGKVHIKHPIASTGCSSNKQESTSLLNLTGSPFYVGESNKLIGIGCNSTASLTNVEPSITGCFSSCLVLTAPKNYLPQVDCNTTNDYGHCSERSCNGNGCCKASMPGSIQQVVGVRIDDNATTIGWCKVAFLSNEAYTLSDRSDPDRVFAKRYSTIELGWFIHTTNLSFLGSLKCATMKEYLNLSRNSSYESTYGIGCACDHNSYFPNYASCSCNSGYMGNPYIPDGCKDKNECTEKDLYCGEDATCVNLRGSYKCVYRNYRLAIGICSSFGSLIFIGGIYGLYKFIKKQRRLNQKKKFFKRNGGLLLQQQLTSTEGSNEKTRVFSSRELENATENFSLTRILGQGGQGTVYKGMLVDGRIVAVKKSKVVDEDKLEEFINEVVILSQINHRNIVKLLGCCLETEVPVLVYEFIPNGNLFEHLHDESDDHTVTTWEVRLCIAIDIAGALSYLHSAVSSPVYHRDVKSTNIMLDEKYRAKVSDFGTSRTVTVDHTHLTTVVSGTVGYVDPEYFQSSQFTDKSDVYSFGVVLAELITGEKSVSFFRSQENRTLATYFLRAVKENRLFDIIDARIKDGCKQNQVNATANLARKCLNLKGRKRPSMRETSMELEKIRASSVDMQLHEHGSENEEDNKKGVVDANIGVQSRNNNTVTAPTSQYDAANVEESIFRTLSGKLVPALSILGKEVVNISLPSHVHSDYPIRMTYGTVRIKNKITSKGCSSNEQESTSLLNLTGSPFYIADSNTLIAVGCNNRASLTNVEPSIVGCFSSCLSTNYIASNDYLATINCYSKSDSDDAYEYCSERSYINETSCNGNRCCKASMPSSDQQVVGVRIDDNAATATRGCKVAFLTDEAYSILDGTDPKLLLSKRYSTVELQWFIDTTNLSFVDSLRCLTMKEYLPISRQYSHGVNNYASCACDFNSSVPNYASCSCNIGYRGNPYILGGCKDISSECPNCVYRYHGQLVIGIGSSLGSLMCIGGIYGLYKFIRKQRRLNQKKKFFKRNGGLLLQQQLTSTEGNVDKTRVFSSRELEKATENFSLTRILGQGGQGTVYKGMLVDGRIVAVKKSKVVDEDKLEEFINEVVILSQINHRNIVKLLGCCLETDVPLLVYEFISNGNLFEHLYDESDDNTISTWEVRLRIAIDIAGALSYLHSAASFPIYHRDIKSTNIMLDEKYRAKVSDFGTSRTVTVDHTHLTTVVSGTVGYVDPEYFQSSQFTDKSDVYSFGVVLAELITGEKSVSFLRSQENKTLATYFILAMKENRLIDIIDARIRDGCKLNQVTATANLARKCLNLKGRKRPSMREVSMELEKICSSSVDMQLHEYGSVNEEENEERIVDADIWIQSWNNIAVTAPTSQYDVGTSSLPISDVEPLFPFQTR
ncbi:hypothetical protein Bca101_045093 [Brassica carinata]